MDPEQGGPKIYGSGSSTLPAGISPRLPLPRVTEESGMASMLDKEDMSYRQCCRSVTFWYGSGSGDLYL